MDRCSVFSFDKVSNAASMSTVGVKRQFVNVYVAWMLMTGKIGWA